MSYLIRQAHVALPDGSNPVGDVLIESDRIKAIGDLSAHISAEIVVEAQGLQLIPGLIDIQTRLREPGESHKATISSESYTALRSGITRVLLAPDTKPVIDNTAVLELIEHINEQNQFCHIHPIAALTKGLQGQELSNMAALRGKGCVAVSNAKKPFQNNRVQLSAMEYAASRGLPVVIQPIDHSLSVDGCMHEGVVATRLGLPSIPEACETAALAKDLELVEQTGARTHFGQLSCARSVAMIRAAKQQGLPVTADVAMHQLFLTERDADGFNSLAKVLPPLRSERDREALIAGVVDGTIDCICSDHQPHERDAKLQPFPSAEPGISALETLLPLGLRLVQQGQVSFERLLQCLCSHPAALFGLDGGTIEVGQIADLVLYDPNSEWQFSREQMLSAGKNNPFQGWQFAGGLVQKTWLAGRLFD